MYLALMKMHLQHKNQDKHGGCVVRLHFGSQQSPLRLLRLPRGNVQTCTLVFVQTFMCMCMLAINRIKMQIKGGRSTSTGQ